MKNRRERFLSIEEAERQQFPQPLKHRNTKRSWALTEQHAHDLFLVSGEAFHQGVAKMGIVRPCDTPLLPVAASGMSMNSKKCAIKIPSLEQCV